MRKSALLLTLGLVCVLVGMLSISACAADIYAGTSAGVIWRLDANLTPLAYQTVGGSAGGAITGIGIQSDGKVVVFNSNGGAWRFSADLNTVYNTQVGLGPISAITVLSDGSTIAGRTDGYIWKLGPDLTPVSTQQVTGSIKAMCALSNDNVAVAMATTGYGWLFKPNLDVIASRVGMGPTTSMDVRQDKIATVRSDGYIELWDSGLNLTHYTLAGSSPFSAVCYQPDGNIVAAKPDGVAWRFNSGLDAIGVVDYFDSVSAMGVLPNGKIVTGRSDGYIELWSDSLGSIAFDYLHSPITCIATTKFAVVSTNSVGRVRAQDDGTSVILSNVRTTLDNYDSGNAIYVEDPDRNAGIRVLMPGTDYSMVGEKINSIEGQVTTIDGEKTIQATSVNIAFDELLMLAPLGMPGKSVAGPGLETSGLLVKTWGKVTFRDSAYFCIDDGSGKSDNAGHQGIPVMLSDGVAAPSADFVSVTGVIGARNFGGGFVPVLRIRDAADVNP